MVPKVALSRGNGGPNIRFYVHDTEKGTSLHGTASSGLGYSELREPPPPPKKKTGKRVKLAE